jgi:hypothetical protein
VPPTPYGIVFLLLLLFFLFHGDRDARGWTGEGESAESDPVTHFLRNIPDMAVALFVAYDGRNFLRHVEQGEIPVTVNELLLVQDTGVDGETFLPAVSDYETTFPVGKDIETRVAVIHLADKAEWTSH